jgi:GNAT superfamily N-acetyltransferase
MGCDKLDTTPPRDHAAAETSWAAPVPVVRAAELDCIFEFRESIWRNERGLIDAGQLDLQAFRDAHDAHGFHWMITLHGSIVAAARMCIHDRPAELPYHDGFCHLPLDLPAPFASLNRMVVHPSVRRQGITRPLTKVRIDAARSMGARSMVVEAAPNRVSTLRELGFVELGQSNGQPGDLVRYTLMCLDLKA